MSFLKKNKQSVLISFFLITMLWFGFHYIFRAPTQIENMKVSYSGKASDFLTLLDKNPLNWNNKPIEISGKITELVGSNFILDELIFCQLKDSLIVKPLPKMNSQITVKGIVVGYDDLLNELKINQCIIKN